MAQVLVIFLGEQFSVWQSPSELLPFRPYASEKELIASELSHSGKLPRSRQFQKGLEVIVAQIPIK